MKYIIVAISIIFGVIGQVLFKKGMVVLGGFQISQIIKILFNPYIFCGFMFYGISSIMWLYVLSKFELSTVYPLLSVGYILTAVAGYYIFSETISTYKIISIVLICSGVILMNWKGGM